MKKIVTMQDISDIGKCSLTVALPILSVMNIECAVVPTAVLSAHTAFEGFTFHDLTDTIPETFDHWKKLGLFFDAVYSGYLGSTRQIGLVRQLHRDFAAPDALKIVDPVMADNGKLYAGFSSAFVEEMAGLCAEADVIVPNLTEACLMGGCPYRDDPSDEFLKDLLKKLAGRGSRYVILTGAQKGKNLLGALGYDRDKNEFLACYNERLPVKYHGTGDIFASCLSGALTGGKSMEEAMRIAVDFTLECIRKTMEDPDHDWYGVNFETALPFLARLTAGE